MACVECFANEGLRRVAQAVAPRPANLCTRCGATAPELSQQDLEEIAFKFFRDGSIPTRSQFGTERFRTADHEPYDPADFQSSLADDCEVLSDAGIWIARYDPSPLWRIGCGDLQLAFAAGGSETRRVLRTLVTTVPERHLPPGSSLHRIRVGVIPPNPTEFDPPPPSTKRRHGRFDSSRLDVLYTSLDVETCLHEVRIGVADDVSLATLKVAKDLRLADLTAFPKDVRLHDSYDLLCRTFCLGGPNYYKLCRRVAAELHSAGFHGFVHESYFSLVKSGAPENIALFGRPLASGLLTLRSVNTLQLRQVQYSYDFGPAPGDDTAG
jgi:hypothetical protein